MRTSPTGLKNLGRNLPSASQGCVEHGTAAGWIVTAKLKRMELRRTRALLPNVEWRATSPSTNAELRELADRAVRAGAPLPHGTLLLTDTQTAGRGRLDRGWVTPPGTSIAMSVLIRGFGVPPSSLQAGAADLTAAMPEWGELGPAWLPLIAGSAVQGALQPLYAEAAEVLAESNDGFDEIEVRRVGVKWPNDVHVRDEADAMAGSPGKKLCGILCELLPDGSAIVGIGLNVLIPEWELPTERATSLLASGAVRGTDGPDGDALTFADPESAALADRLVSGIVSELVRLCDLADRDPGAVRARVLRNSLTLGTEVRVHLPAGDVVDGRARDLASDGSLVVDLPTGGQLTVSAGDVQHLR